MEVFANEQAFQSIYLDPTPEDWRQKIVFLEPLFDTLPPAEMVFKTLRLEGRPGMVISGPKVSLVKLKNHITEADDRDAIGKAGDNDILRYLSDLAKEVGLTVQYAQTAAEAKLRTEAERAGYEKIGDVYISPDNTKIVSLVDDKLVGLSTANFKVRGLTKFIAVFDESWGETDKKLNLRDPHFIPSGISKVEAARWYVSSRRITKPLNTLETIANLAAKAGCAKKESKLAKLKPKFEALGLDVWSDEKESEYVGVTTVSDYEEGVYPEKVAYFDLINKEFKVPTDCSVEVASLIEELASVLREEK